MAGPYGVVIVPGFLGSTLSFGGGAGGKTKLWWNPSAILQYTPLALALAGDGVSPYPVVGRTLFPDGPVDLGIYEPLVTAAANAGFNPIFWSYDWRLSQLALAGKFRDFLGSIALSDPFYIVAHSNGGLVAQLTYPLWLARPNSPTWAATAYLGVPQGGCYAAAQNLAGLYTTGGWLLILARALGLASELSPLVGTPNYAALLALATTVTSWPGLYGLLPSSLGPWANLDPLSGAVMTRANYSQAPVLPQQQWLDLGLQVQQALVNGYGQPRPLELCAYGTGEGTAVALSDGSNLAARRSYITSFDGDGTTQVSRTILPICTEAAFEGADHYELCTTWAPTQHMLELVKDLPKPVQKISTAPVPITGVPIGPIQNIVGPPVPSPFLNVTMDP